MASGQNTKATPAFSRNGMGYQGCFSSPAPYVWKPCWEGRRDTTPMARAQPKRKTWCISHTPLDGGLCSLHLFCLHGIRPCFNNLIQIRAVVWPWIGNGIGRAHFHVCQGVLEGVEALVVVRLQQAGTGRVTNINITTASHRNHFCSRGSCCLQNEADCLGPVAFTLMMLCSWDKQIHQITSNLPALPLFISPLQLGSDTVQRQHASSL